MSVHFPAGLSMCEARAIDHRSPLVLQSERFESFEASVVVSLSVFNETRKVSR